MKVRKDLIQLVAMLVFGVVGAVLAYRYGTGQTKAVESAEMAETKALKEIAGKTPGDAEAMQKKLAADALKLETDTKQKEERERLDREAQAALKIAQDSMAGRTTTVPGTDARPEMTQAELDAAELARQRLAVRTSKIMAWEDTDGLKSLLNVGSSSSFLQQTGQDVTPGAIQAYTQNAQNSANDRANALTAALTNLKELAAASAGASGGASATKTGTAVAASTMATATPTLNASTSSFAGLQDKGDQVPLFPTLALSKYTLHQGSLIPAVMLNAIDAEMAGDIRATVMTDVYDSISKSYIVIPKGTMLIGMYSSEIANGQERLLFGFNRMIFQNGASVNLSNMRGSDATGKAGLAADVDSRFWRIFGTSLLIGAVTNFTKPLTDWLFPAAAAVNNANSAASGSSSSRTVVTEVTDPKTGNKTTTTTSSTSNNSDSSSSDTGSGNKSALNLSISTAASNSASSALDETAKRILDRNQNIKPSMRLKEGEKFNIMVARDMVLPPSLTQVRTTSGL